MIKPNFESSVHTARDLVERDLIVYDQPGTEIWKQMLSESDIPEYRIIGKNLFITKSWDQFDEMTTNEMLSQGTHAQMASYLQPYELAWATAYDHDQGRYNFNVER